MHKQMLCISLHKFSGCWKFLFSFDVNVCVCVYAHVREEKLENGVCGCGGDVRVFVHC